MPLVLKDRVQETTTSTGTGTITLAGATTGFQAFSAVGNGNQTYYTITDGTNWEAGIGTYTSSGTTLSRDTVLASSNSGNLVNFSAGTKTVFSPLPAIATQGSSATGDNSSIGTNLYAWNNFKKLLDKSVVGGAAYSNNNTNGIIRTYSLLVTGPLSYLGNVLSPNGDVHFILTAGEGAATYPAVGQKISSSNVVSTYSLIYTIGGGYIGGVLASNGDIHFVPFNAAVGQKISLSGVVSTYSLVYSGGAGGLNRYQGGILAPNGDIHFIPRNAAVGQKVSASGTVSTYSLVYTKTDAYIGGVLAPNGDIHFVPRTANGGGR